MKDDALIQPKKTTTVKEHLGAQMADLLLQTKHQQSNQHHLGNRNLPASVVKLLFYPVRQAI
jgi:hypothetical protein